MPGGAGNAGGVVACGVVVLAVAWSAFGPSSPSALPTRASGPGTCHVAADPGELTATASDTAPAVPCDQVHQTETLWTGRVADRLAAEKRRPNPELINAMLGRSCDDFGRVQAYVGADDHDAQWGIIVEVKVPTPQEWAGGDRTFRCDARPPARGFGPPAATGTLRDVLRRNDSAMFRLCESRGAAVTCDQPHDREAVTPSVSLDGPTWPGDQALRTAAVTACSPMVEAYLGRPLASRPELVVTADVPDRNAWDAGTRNAACWVGSSGSTLATGTLRGGLR